METVIHSDNDFATVAYLRIKSATLEPKSSVGINPQIPPLLEDEYDSIRIAVEESQDMHGPVVDIPKYSPESSVLYWPPSTKLLGPWVAITNVHRRLVGGEISIEDEVRECFCQLQGWYPVYVMTPRRFTDFDSPITETFPQHLQLREHQYLYIVHGLICAGECSLPHILR